MLPEPLTSLVGDVQQDLERVYAEWCLEVEHPDLVAFVEHLLTWRLITPVQAQAVLDAAHPEGASAVVFSDAPPSESAEDPPTVRDEGFGPEPTFERPATPVDSGFAPPSDQRFDPAETPGVRHEEGSVEEFDLFDEADMATVHDSAWPGRPVESDEIEVLGAETGQGEALSDEFGPGTVPVAEDWADANPDEAAEALAPRPAPPPLDLGPETVEPARRADEPPPVVEEPAAPPEAPEPVAGVGAPPAPTGPEPLSPFTALPDDDEPIGDLETVIKKTPPIGELETFVRTTGPEQDLKSMVTAVPATPRADFDADTVQPAPESVPPPPRASEEAWGSPENEPADDTDTVTQAPPELVEDLIEGLLDEEEASADALALEEPSPDPTPKADSKATATSSLTPVDPLPSALAETRVPARRDDSTPQGGEKTLPAAAVHHLAEGASKAFSPVLTRLREEPRLRVAAVVVGALLVIGIVVAGWQVQAALQARAERDRQTFVRAVTVGAVQASILESAFVAGLGPLDATATLLTEAYENGVRWQSVVGRPPSEFRSASTLPSSGGAFDRSPAKTEGSQWIDVQVPAVIVPPVEQQNPRWGAVSRVFAQHLPPMLNDRAAVFAVWVGLEDGFYVTLPGRNVDDDFDPREHPVYRNARLAASSVDWHSNRYGLLTVARPLVSTDTSAFLGVAAVQFDEEWIVDHLLPRALGGVPDVGAVLLDEGAMVVAATDREGAKAINPGLWEAMAEADPARSSGYRIVRDDNGIDQLYVFHRLTTMGWTHVIYGPRWRLTKSRQPVVPGVGAPPEAD